MFIRSTDIIINLHTEDIKPMLGSEIVGCDTLILNCNGTVVRQQVEPAFCLISSHTQSLHIAADVR